ncbi:MAG: divalent-cation tolerance protein CutA [Chthoniobacterales bacterium]
MIVVGISTFASEEDAEQVVEILVKESLIACGTILPQAKSIYRWEGKLEKENEVMVLMKTLEHHLPALQKRLHELHKYEVPEFMAFEVCQVSERYADWLKAMCSGSF